MAMGDRSKAETGEVVPLIHSAFFSCPFRSSSRKQLFPLADSDAGRRVRSRSRCTGVRGNEQCLGM